jgi:diguanylate cyclase (GGDEF)-like protein
VVLLPGREDSQLAQELAAKAFAHGVYDIIWDPVSVEETVKLILEPNTYAKAGMKPDEGAVGAPKPKRAKQKSILGLFFRKQKTHVKKEGAAESPEREDKEGLPTPESADLFPPANGREPGVEQGGKVGSSETVFIPKSIGSQPQKEGKAETPAEKQTALPEDFAFLGSEKFPSVPALLAALPGGYTAVVLPSDWPHLEETIKQLRQEPSVSALPIVVVGPCDAKKCYAAGVGECVDVLDAVAVERIRAKAARAREIPALIGSGLPVGVQGAPVPDGPAPAKEAPEAKGPGAPAEDKKEINTPGADRDLLTGCCTRRHLVERFSLEGSYSVIFIDLDGFKPVNDVLGHEAGDRVLSAFGEILTRNLKGKDLAVRWGGDEFVLILPETSRAGAEKVLRNLREEWKSCAPDTGNLEVGFSAGIAEGKGANSLQRAIREADKLMYAAKKAGKAGRTRESGNRDTSSAQKERLPAVELLSAFWLAVKISLEVVAVMGLASLAVWLADFAVCYAGAYSPVLHGVAKAVEWFWGAFFAGLTGKAV